MSVPLSTLTSCFQGLIPATLYTCAADGTPNAAYLSHVEYVDASHVALSFQFFNKSRRNVAENPRAVVRVVDPDTQQGWELRLRFVRSETSGGLFERMALRIEAIASYCGMKGVFKLLAADVYEVVTVRRVPEQPGRPSLVERRTPDAVFTMRALQDLSRRVDRADGLEPLIDAILQGLDDIFGFTHSMILLPGERPGTLVTIATHGYPENGAGAEARFGEGIAGLVAEAMKPIRIAGLMRGMLYAYASNFRANEPGWCPPERRVALPGLASPDSQLGVPLIVRGELVGVLCIESEVPYRFHEDDRATVELLGSYLAIAIQNAVLREERADDDGAAAPVATPESNPPTPPREPRVLTFYRTDECVLIDGEYLIRGLPAKVLWKLLGAHATEGRTEFTNRELRLDKSLQLPAYKDNLETRLLLLRRRLEQKCPDIRLVPSGRGRFALELAGPVTLAERP